MGIQYSAVIFRKIAGSLLISVIMLILLFTTNTGSVRSTTLHQDSNRLNVIAENSNDRPAFQDSWSAVKVARQAPNLFAANDPSFESERWPLWGSCNAVLDPAEAYHGNQSARIDSSTEWCHLFKVADEVVEPERVYDFSCWIKNNRTSGEAYVRLWFLDEDKNELVGQSSQNIGNTNGSWEEATGSLIAPPEAKFVQLRLTVPDEDPPDGSVWFDHCYVGLAIDLAISKQGIPAEAGRGQLVTFTVQFSNSGREEARNIFIAETYDRNLEDITTTPEPSSSQNLWHIPALSPGMSDAITISGRVIPTAEDNFIANLVQLTSLDTPSFEVTDIVTITITPSLTLCSVDIAGSALNPQNSGKPGERTTHHYLLTNKGSASGEASLAVSAPFSSSIVPPASFLLTAGASISVAAQVDIPDDVTVAISGTYLLTTTAVLTCDTQSDSDSATSQLLIEQVRGVNIEGDQPLITSANSVSFTHWVTNTGNWTDDITLSTTASPADLAVSVAPVTVLRSGPGEGSPFTLAVAGIAGNAVISVTAALQNDPSITDSVTDRIDFLKVFTLNIGPDQKKWPLETLIFTHSLENRGNWTDTIALSYIATPADLTVTIEPTTTWTLPAQTKQPVSLRASGISTNILAKPRAKAVITLTASSQSTQSISAQTVDIATIAVHSVYLPLSFCDPFWNADSDNVSDALVFECMKSVSGTVDQKNDRSDVYKVLSGQNDLLTIDLTGSNPDADLYLFPPETTEITDYLRPITQSKGLTSDEEIVFQTTYTGYWYIRVLAYEGSIDYTLTVERESGSR